MGREAARWPSPWLRHGHPLINICYNISLFCLLRACTDGGALRRMKCRSQFGAPWTRDLSNCRVGRGARALRWSVRPGEAPIQGSLSARIDSEVVSAVLMPSDVPWDVRWPALERAHARGEIRHAFDVELVLDLLTGPFYFRALFGHAPMSHKTLVRS